jgi:hypothetical protein
VLRAISQQPRNKGVALECLAVKRLRNYEFRGCRIARFSFDLEGGFCAELAADDDGARSSRAGCAEQRREVDTRMDSPSRSPDRSMPSQEEMDAAETSSLGRAPKQRRPVNDHSQTSGVRHHSASRPAKPIEDLHELTLWGRFSDSRISSPLGVVRS